MVNENITEAKQINDIDSYSENKPPSKKQRMLIVWTTRCLDYAAVKKTVLNDIILLFVFKRRNIEILISIIQKAVLSSNCMKIRNIGKINE